MEGKYESIKEGTRLRAYLIENSIYFDTESLLGKFLAMLHRSVSLKKAKNRLGAAVFSHSQRRIANVSKQAIAYLKC